MPLLRAGAALAAASVLAACGSASAAARRAVGRRLHRRLRRHRERRRRRHRRRHLAHPTPPTPTRTSTSRPRADTLAVSRATVFVANGGGYDDFAAKLLRRGRATSRCSVVVTALSGFETDAPDFNEHVWYDLPTMKKLADHLATALGAADQPSANRYLDNAKKFDAQVDGLMTKVAAIKAKHAGVKVAITEPVPGYLLDAAGLVVVTPPRVLRGRRGGHRPARRRRHGQQHATFDRGQGARRERPDRRAPTTTQAEQAAAANGVPVVQGHRDPARRRDRLRRLDERPGRRAGRGVGCIMTDVATRVRTAAAVSLRGAALRFGERTLWDGLDLDVAPGEFLAVLGPNGSGKTTLLRVLLGLQPLSRGRGADRRAAAARAAAAPSATCRSRRRSRTDLPLRARDLVGLGLDGHRLGVGLRGRAVAPRTGADAALDVGRRRGHYADAPVGRLSGGEQQRLRVAQALVGDPSVLLCDEPLLSLDLAHQQVVTEPDRPAAARGRHGRRVRHARDQPGPAARRPRAVPRGRPLPDRHARRGDDLGHALDALPHRRRRAAGARAAGRGRRRRARTRHCHPEEAT